MCQFRPETAADHAAVEAVHRAAFPTDDEAALVAALRESDAFVPGLSIVAEADAGIVGHVLFTEVSVSGGGRTGRDAARPDAALTLAPVAVSPDRQGEGIGSRLIRHGLDACREAGYECAVLHGDPDFYSRFGFEPAAPYGFSHPFDLPDADFQVLWLTDEENDRIGGRVTYDAAFLDL
ncbi:GNAT family N-acetyltransferase [Haloarchaeobius amylolyticus]|uniref:GNAT family N-acetyltransferase n=1 Tax=Haloarchaeobius amylolyticus TaxID=1198296 RepID=UPI00226DC24C|nr:N-acetyltransferase [Haloarchaeobius amylolyticus]